MKIKTRLSFTRVVIRSEANLFFTIAVSRNSVQKFSISCAMAGSPVVISATAKHTATVR